MDALTEVHIMAAGILICSSVLALERMKGVREKEQDNTLSKKMNGVDREEKTVFFNCIVKVINNIPIHDVAVSTGNLQCTVSRVSAKQKFLHLTKYQLYAPF